MYVICYVLVICSVYQLFLSHGSWIGLSINHKNVSLLLHRSVILSKVI